MMPKRADELLDGGSLYWVIKGKIQARQEITDIIRITSDDGIRRCKLMLSNDVIPTDWQPKRAFQGVALFEGGGRSSGFIQRPRRHPSPIAH